MDEEILDIDISPEVCNDTETSDEVKASGTLDTGMTLYDLNK